MKNIKFEGRILKEKVGEIVHNHSPEDLILFPSLSVVVEPNVDFFSHNIDEQFIRVHSFERKTEKEFHKIPNSSKPIKLNHHSFAYIFLGDNIMGENPESKLCVFDLREMKNTFEMSFRGDDRELLLDASLLKISCDELLLFSLSSKGVLVVSLDKKKVSKFSIRAKISKFSIKGLVDGTITLSKKKKNVVFIFVNSRTSTEKKICSYDYLSGEIEWFSWKDRSMVMSSCSFSRIKTFVFGDREILVLRYFGHCGGPFWGSLFLDASTKRKPVDDFIKKMETASTGVDSVIRNRFLVSYYHIPNSCVGTYVRQRGDFIFIYDYHKKKNIFGNFIFPENIFIHSIELEDEGDDGEKYTSLSFFTISSSTKLEEKGEKPYVAQRNVLEKTVFHKVMINSRGYLENQKDLAERVLFSRASPRSNDVEDDCEKLSFFEVRVMGLKNTNFPKVFLML